MKEEYFKSKDATLDSKFPHKEPKPHKIRAMPQELKHIYVNAYFDAMGKVPKGKNKTEYANEMALKAVGRLFEWDVEKWVVRDPVGEDGDEDANVAIRCIEDGNET